MAEQERMTKAERREEKRIKRAAEEAAAKEAAKKASRRNAAALVGLVAVIGGLVYLAVGLDTTPPATDETVLLTEAGVEEARLAAGCEVIDVVPIEARDHLSPAEAPPAEVLYTNGRPTATGPHYENPGPIYVGVLEEPLDERSTTHNLEHGSVLVWLAEDGVSQDVVDEVDGWVVNMNEAGFEDGLGRGAGVIASMYGEPGIDSGKNVAFRAWGQAMDCDSWDQTVANAFLFDHFGTNGNAPEAFFGEFPETVIQYTDGDEAPSDESEAPSDEATPSVPAPTDDPTE